MGSNPFGRTIKGIMEELIYLLDFYKKRVERNPQLLSSHAVYSEYLLLSERIEESILISLKSLLVSPWFLRSQIDLGLSYLLKGDYKSSETELKHALKIDPEFDYAYLLLGILYYTLDIYDIATNYLKEGFNYNPNNYYIRNLYYIITKKELPSNSHFKETEEKVLNGFINSEEMLKIRIENSNKKPYEILYAISLKNENRLIEAIEILERILIYNPYYPNALYILGKFYEMSGNRRKKDECWEKCIEVNPLMDKVKNLIKNFESIYFDLNDLKVLSNLTDKIINFVFYKLVTEEVAYEKVSKEKSLEKPLKEIKEEEVLVKEEELVVKEEEIEKVPINLEKPKEEIQLKLEKEEIEPPLDLEGVHIELETEEIQKEKIPYKEEEIIIEKEEVKPEKSEIEGSNYYKKLGDEYLKKGMYKEAIEMFAKALKLSKER